MVYCFDMYTEIAKYVFWIMICLPVFVTGVFLFTRLVKSHRFLTKAYKDSDPKRRFIAEYIKKVFSRSN